jgi:hypothetical protein
VEFWEGHENIIADFNPLYAIGNLHDRSAHVVADFVWEGGRFYEAQLTGSLHHINRIDAGGVDFDQNVVVGGDGRGCEDGECVGRSVFVRRDSETASWEGWWQGSLPL